MAGDLLARRSVQSSRHLPVDRRKTWLRGEPDIVRVNTQTTATVNPLKTKRKLFHLKTQFVPRSKHFSSRLKKQINLRYISKSRCLL
jgi:hypothetical protein